jgi:endonuclease/exonuclease/phosphatase family metal-dependent hydrolase
VAEKWQITDPQDLNLSPGHKLRFASYLVLHLSSGRSIHLLSVHLKAGCRGRFKRNRSCTLLREQGLKLHGWIKDRQERQESFMILGDFNHNLAYPRDWLWQALAGEADSATSENVILATRNTEAECKVRSRHNPKRTYRYRNLIDHIVVSRDLAYSQPKQYIYPTEQVVNYRLSDHCPVNIQIDH